MGIKFVDMINPFPPVETITLEIIQKIVFWIMGQR